MEYRLILLKLKQTKGFQRKNVENLRDFEMAKFLRTQKAPNIKNDKLDFIKILK